MTALCRLIPAWLLAGVALVLCYAPVLAGMSEQWWTDEDMGHAFAVPLVAGWVTWRERDRWRVVPASPSRWGFGLLTLGASFQCAGALGAGLFAGAVGFLISLAGVVAALGGFGLLRTLAFPFLLALFMLPKLAIVYNQATLPLQLVASHLAAAGLAATGTGVLREGNILQVNGISVAVEEACNGIRYLLPLGFLSLVYGYIAGDRTWMRAVLLAAAVPLAILANALRVAAAAAYPALAEGAAHMLFGWALFVLCLAGLGAVHCLLGKPRRRTRA